MQQKEQMRHDYKFSEGGNMSEQKMGRAWIPACTCNKLGIIPHSSSMWQHKRKQCEKVQVWLNQVSEHCFRLSLHPCISNVGHHLLQSRTTILTRSLLVLLAVFTQCSHLDISNMADSGHKTANYLFITQCSCTEYKCSAWGCILHCLFFCLMFG